MLRAWAGVMTAAALVALAGGCASSKRARAPVAESGSGPAVKPSAPALDELRRAADDQVRRPVAEATKLAPPPGLTPEIVKALRPATGPNVRIPLDRAIEALAGTEPDTPPAASHVDEDAQREAMRRYVTARQKVLEGKAAEAVTDLREALRLDPGAGEAWRELAEAQLQMGSANEAADSLKKAEAAGVREPRVLELLGRFAADRGDGGAAARWLARAMAARTPETDPLLVPVIEHEFARVLAAIGYDMAARDALLRLLGRAPSFTATSRYMADYGAIFRRQGDLWRHVGDLEMRLGQPGAALAAYEKAAELPTVDGQSPMPRLVYAAMKTGRPAAAGAALVGRISDSGGRVSDEDLRMLRHIAEAPGTRRAVTEALARVQESQGTSSPTRAAGLARARAAVAAPADALRLLTAHIVDHPRDLEAAAALINTAAEPRTAAEAAAACVERQPASAAALGEGIVRSRHDPEAVVEALRASPGSGAVLVRAWVGFKQGFVPASADLAAGVPIEGRFAGAAALTRAELGIAAGRPAEAQTSLEALRRSAKVAGAERSVSLILAMLQRHEEALGVLAPLLEGPATQPEERIENLLIAAQLGAITGRADDTERWLRAAAALDPGDDRALGVLLELYAPGSPKADPAKQGRIVRELRQDHTDGRVLRIARARELVRRSLFAQAEREGQEFAADYPGDKSAVEILTAAWGARGRPDAQAAVRHGLGWLEAQSERRPLDALLAAARATLMTSSDRAEEAEVMLRQLLERGAGQDVSRILERVLRENLGNAKEADALALRRLGGRTRTVTEALELAEVHARAGRTREAAEAVKASLVPGLALLPDQRLRLLTLGRDISGIALQALVARKPDADAQQAGVALIGLAVDRGVVLPAPLHEVRLRLLPAAGASADEILRACDLATAQAPELNSRPVLWPLATLVQSREGPRALELASRAATRPGKESVELFGAWCEVIGMLGSAPDIRALVDAADRAGKLQELADRVRGSGLEGVKDHRAEVAYLMGDTFTRNGRITDANAAYELALEYQPDHGWAANNLGYFLADRGGDLARAERLLETAVEALPDQGPVLDSLGWLRYKQGRLEDTAQPGATDARQRGAVSLLQRAAMTERGQSDAVILDHLGDALWLTGRKAEAQRYWTLAHASASQVLAQRIPAVAEDRAAGGAGVAADDPAFAELRTLVEACARKRSDASGGGPVRVAPQAANPDPQPRALASEGDTPTPSAPPAPTTPTDDPH